MWPSNLIYYLTLFLKISIYDKYHMSIFNFFAHIGKIFQMIIDAYRLIGNYPILSHEI
jgi:hypothetical protein